MSKRFAPLSEPHPGSRFANLRERLDAPLYAELSDNDYPGAGSRLSRPDASAQTAEGVAPAKAKAAAPVATPEPTAAALLVQAKADARAKVVAVKASSAYKCREVTARKLLLTGKHSAADITKTLASEPLDAQLAAVNRHLKAKAVNKVWQGNRSAVRATLYTYSSGAAVWLFHDCQHSSCVLYLIAPQTTGMSLLRRIL